MACHSCEELPSEMVMEILTRTSSLTTLKQCTRVFNSWNNIINEPTFIPLHCNRTNSLFGCFFQGIKQPYKHTVVFASAGGAATITWPDEDMKILASSSDGILCCSQRNRKNYRYYVCKPAANQWQPLPNPKLRYETEAVALVVVESCPLRYIIIRLSKNHRNSNPFEWSCEIFDSRKWVWDRIKCGFNLYEDQIKPLRAAIVIGKSVHWLTLSNVVLTFNLITRSFGRLRLPESTQCHEEKRVVEYQGKLGFICMRGKEMELWVVEAEGRRWRREIVADMTRVDDYPEPIRFCGDSVVMMKTGDGVAFYNLENCSIMSRLQVPHHHLFPITIFPFRSDLEIVNLKAH